MDSFYSRCLLCTCKPDFTSHIHIFSEAGNQLQLADKINKLLNIQIEAELPQNVCHSCMAKLEATSEFVRSSQQARIMLLQMKQQDENVDLEVHQNNLDSSMAELDSYQLATDKAAIDNKDSMDHNQWRTYGMLMNNSVANCSAEDFVQSGSILAVQLSEGPSHVTVGNNTTNAETRLLDVRKRAGTSETPIIPPKKLKIRKHDYGGPVKCDICNVFMKHKYCLIQHKNKKHDMNLPFDCAHCARKYLTFNDIILHVTDAHPVKDQVCEVCGQMFTKSEYPSHLKTHPQKVLNDIKLHPVDCSLCKFTARNKFSLLLHINSEHLDVVLVPLPFCCELCNREYTSYKNVMQHFRLVHTTKIKCVHCGRKIIKHKMKNHLKLHHPAIVNATAGNLEGTAPFEEVFISDFIQEHTIKQEPEEEMEFIPQNADVEESGHLEYQALQCEVCSFYTNNKTQLATHMQAHQTHDTPGGKRRRRVLSRKSRVLLCPHCELRYGYPEVLAWHIANCHGPDAVARVVKIGDSKHNFQCVICEAMFRTQQFVVLHLHTQHRISNLIYKCKCGRSFVCREPFLKHQLKCEEPEDNESSTTPQHDTEVSIEGFKCKMCNKMFKTKKQMESHISTFHALNISHMYKCCHCDETFRFFPRLKKHCVSKHPGKFIVKCDLCKHQLVTFTTYHGFRLHNKSKHGAI